MRSLPQPDAPATNQRNVRSEVGAELPALFGLAVALTGDRIAAQDLLQAAAVRVLTTTGEIHSIGPYLRRTVINLHTDGLRRLHLEHSVGEQRADPPIWIDGSSDVTSRLDLDRALAKLPTLTRTVLILRFLEDMSAARVGEILARPAGTVRRLTHEGLSSLRKSNILAGYGKDADDE